MSFENEFSNWLVDKVDHQALLRQFQEERYEAQAKADIDRCIIRLKCQLAGRLGPSNSVDPIPYDAEKRFDISHYMEYNPAYAQAIRHKNSDLIPLRKLDLAQTTELINILKQSPYWLEALMGTQDDQTPTPDSTL